jgi:heptosyltransferase-1
MSPRHALVVKPSSLGDIVHTLPAVHALKSAWPETEISWLVNTEWMPLLEGNPDLTRVIAFPRREFRGWRGCGKLARWAPALRVHQPDLALDFQGLARSALLSRASGAKRIHGLSDARECAGLLYHRTVRVNPTQHSVERYLALVEDLGIEVQRPLQFRLPAGDRPAGFAAGEPYLLLHPFSRGAGKSLTTEALRELCSAVAPWPVVLVGRSHENWAEHRGVTSLLNQTSIAELIFLIRHAAWTVSVDSGPMHIAAALTDKLLGIHTWSDPRLVGPYRSDAWVWKGGAISQVANLEPQQLQGAAPFAPEHAPAVARFLRDRLSESDAAA